MKRVCKCGKIDELIIQRSDNCRSCATKLGMITRNKKKCIKIGKCIFCGIGIDPSKRTCFLHEKAPYKKKIICTICGKTVTGSRYSNAINCSRCNHKKEVQKVEKVCKCGKIIKKVPWSTGSCRKCIEKKSRENSVQIVKCRLCENKISVVSTNLSKSTGICLMCGRSSGQRRKTQEQRDIEAAEWREKFKVKKTNTNEHLVKAVSSYEYLKDMPEIQSIEVFKRK